MIKLVGTVFGSMLLVALSGCEKAVDKPAATPAQATNRATQAPVSAAPTVTKPATPTADEGKAPSYRRVEATLHKGGKAIEILVPEDVEFGLGRLIEVREDANGEFYFESLIPQ